MPLDSRLYDIMHGKDVAISDNSIASKDRFEIAIRSKIKQQVECLILEGVVVCSNLLPESVQKESAEMEMLNSVDLTEFNNHLILAVSILVNESNQYLNRNDSAHLLQELDRINRNIGALELAGLNDEILHAALNMTSQGLSSILEIAIAKSNEGLLSESLALFALLTTLDSAEPNYWYRLGLVAQKKESFDLAARAYATTSSMAPTFVEAPAFASECWMRVNQREKALTELAKAKAIMQTAPSKEWQQYVVDLESLLYHQSNKGKL